MNHVFIIAGFSFTFHINNYIDMGKMGKTFEKIQVHVIGSFEDSNKVSGWMKANGGKYHRSFNSQVTHLIVSEEVYLQNGEESELTLSRCFKQY